MSTYETILYEVDDRVATITFTRPESLNSLTARPLAEFLAATIGRLDRVTVSTFHRLSERLGRRQPSYALSAAQVVAQRNPPPWQAQRVRPQSMLRP